MENLNYKNKSIEKKYLKTWYDLLIDYIPEPIRKWQSSRQGTVNIVSLTQNTSML